MIERLKVLIVDDDKTWLAFLTAALQEKYDVQTASHAYTAEELADKWLPDTILLDIEMPIKDGYAVCKTLKINPNTKDIPIIFISAKSSLQEKVLGFELGADDYLVKPCEAEYLQAKVARSAAQHREKLDADAKTIAAQNMAFGAMNSSVDLGRSLRFAERTYAMNNFDKLAEGLFQTMAEFGLEASVMFITESGPLFYTHNQYDMSLLEQDMFVAVHQEGRFCDFGRRTFCNFKQISLLIKNMPLEDPERYGRIKDAIPWILGSADGRVGALNLHNTLAQQHQQVASTIQALRARLAELAAGFTNSNQQLATNAEALFHIAQAVRIHLSEAEKTVAGGEPGNHYQQILDQLAHSNHVSLELGQTLVLLDQLAEQQKSVNEAVKRNALSESNELGEDEIFSSGVDFF